MESQGLKTFTLFSPLLPHRCVWLAWLDDHDEDGNDDDDDVDDDAGRETQVYQSVCPTSRVICCVSQKKMRKKS